MWEMNRAKPRLDVRVIEYDEKGSPVYRGWYLVGRKEFEDWVYKTEMRFNGDWGRARREMVWKRGKGDNILRYLGPKLRKRRNEMFRYYWSKEFVTDKVNELVREGIPVNYTSLALKLNVSVFCLFKRMAKLGMKLDVGGKPLNLHGMPPKVEWFKKVNYE